MTDDLKTDTMEAAPDDKHPGGRPTKFKEEYCDQVYRLCLLGLVDVEIAEFFEVTEGTLNNWKNEYPQFLESIRAGKMIADGQVAKSLFDAAIGAEFEIEKAVKVKCGKDAEKVEVVKLKCRAAPDTKAAIYFLNNRTRKQKEKWMDRVDHTTDGEKIPMSFTLDMGGATDVRDSEED